MEASKATQARGASASGLKRHRGRVRGLFACALIAFSACATLPDAPRMPARVADPPVAFETAKGPVSDARSAAILERIRDQAAPTDILGRHLAHEEAIHRDSPLVLGNRLVLLEDGPATYRAMFAAIRDARDHVNLETYIFEAGRVGEAFADLLLQKQRAGVQVNLIYDGIGSLGTPAAFFDRLREAGVRTLEYNPVNPARAKNKDWTLNNRNHRKLLVVDGRVAFLGGINISETYSSGSGSGSGGGKKRRPPGWRDTHLQIEGPVVAEFQKTFIDTWARQNGPPLPERNYFPRVARQGDGIVRAIASRATDPDSPIYLTLLSAIAHAERSIRLTIAYFVPDPQMREALAAAARRGVDVEIILPGKSDSWIVFQAGRSHYDEMLDAGVKLYERREAILHSKTATIDGVWSTIGSTNLDWRSFLHNDELNAVVLGSDFAGQMDAMFARDRAASTPIDAAQWRRRPFHLRVQEWIARRFEYWL